MSMTLKLAASMLLVVAAAACSSTPTEPRTGKACESCSYGYVPVDTHRSERRAVCIVKERVVNCDRVPADCNECARRQRRDLDRDQPYTR